jgi:predicted RNA-binding protein with PIN domain
MAAAPTRHLLVDGSNVMHAWPELRALLPDRRESARGRLAQAVGVLHDLEGIRVTLVFDGRGAQLSVEQPTGAGTFAQVHTPAGVTADDAIIQLVRQARRPADCVVATDDRGERQAVEALGAAVISADDLAGWVGRAGERQQARLDAGRRENEQRWRAHE